MWATGSAPNSRLLEAAWAVFAIVNVGLMYVFTGQETIPFHLVWIGLGLIYGYVRWSPTTMIVVLLTVAVTTGSVLVHHAQAGVIGWEETTEVPLMTCLFLAMVWHVNRRQHVLAQVQRLAATEHRRLEAQQHFVRLSSHELRTPITVARGYTEMVRMAHPDPATQDDTGVVLDELDKLTRITQRLVTLMQMNSPSLPALVDLDAELARIVRRWEPTADRRWIVSSRIGTVSVDQERLETALDCLLENAVKFTAAGDRIAVTGRLDGAGWTVTVTDSGVGLPADVSDQSPPTENGERAQTGTGLGLAIVRAAVAARGGTVEIGPGPDTGTAVRIWIPIATPEDVTTPVRRHDRTDARAVGGP